MIHPGVIIDTWELLPRSTSNANLHSSSDTIRAAESTLASLYWGLIQT